MDKEIARSLVEIEAVSLRIDPPFTWASGRLSPIYCDNRLLMSYPSKRELVAKGFARIIETMGFKPDVIAGTATAGIPHAAWLANLMNLPMAYVRGGAKKHGKGNQVEGKLERGQKVVLVEDLISTGGSSLEAATALVDHGADLLGVVAIFTYGLEKARTRFEEARIPLATLTNFDVLLEQGLEMGILTPASKAIISEWKKDPGAWSADRGGAD